MIKISVPASSANIGPGFDCLGLALDLSNKFAFELSDDFKLIGFEERYVENNLVLYSYLEVFKAINKEPVKVSITQISEDVPTSRGLGSSATCIVAGVLAARYYLNNEISIDDCFNIASNIEGHPDNIAPAIFGGLVASFKDESSYKCVKYEVANNLKFNVLVPNFELLTDNARKVLPTNLGYSDIIYNVSRAINIPYAFSKGDLNLIKSLLNDKMHEPYRMDLIKDSKKIKTVAHKNNCSFSISGAGPSLLVISENDVLDMFNDFSDFKKYELNVSSNGAILEVIK